MANLTFTVAGITLLVGGAYGLLWGRRRREPYELITETPTTRVGELSAPGVVELKGRATVPDGGPGTVPPGVDRQEGVLSVWKVEEWDDESNAWKTIASGIDSVPFALDDGTGEVLVAVGDYADTRGWVDTVSNPAASEGVSFGDVVVEVDGHDVVETVGAEAETPGHVRAFVDAHSAIPTQSGSITNVVDVGNAHGDRRYRATTFAEGDQLYVLGRAYPRDEDRDPDSAFRPEDLFVTAPEGDDDGMLILSNEPEEELVGRHRYHLLGLVLGGASLLGGLVLVGLGL